MKLVWVVSVFLSLFIKFKSTMGDRKVVGRKMVGGYQRMDADDLENDEVLQAASFAVQALTNKDHAPSYSFLGEEEDYLKSISNSDIHVIRGFRQVVAGLNYRLILAITRPQGEEEKDCIGAFSVTIYDHFGDLSVTTWGKEMDCARAMAALENDDALNDALADHFSG
eukprot:scaffold34615_cov180-Amphora_coffeaeformis.AAC.5